MPVATANPAGGLAASVAVAPAAFVTAALLTLQLLPPQQHPPVTVAVGANFGVCGRDPTTQCQQSIIAGGSICDQLVFPLGIRGRNSNQVALLAQMNQEVARGIESLNSFMPETDERCQARLEAVLTGAHQRHSAALANERPTMVAIEQLIDWLENQLVAILNAI